MLNLSDIKETTTKNFLLKKKKKKSNNKLPSYELKNKEFDLTQIKNKILKELEEDKQQYV